MYIEKLKGNTIGYPMTPSVWTPDSLNFRDITKLVISYCNDTRELYVERLDDFQSLELNNKFIYVDNIFTGKEECINTNFIIRVEDFVLVSAKFFCNNPNYKEYEKRLCEIFFLLDEERSIHLIRDYMDTNTLIKVVE